MTMKGIFGLEVGKVYINSLGHKIEVLGMHEKMITYSINNTTYWGTDYDRFFDIISRWKNIFENITKANNIIYFEGRRKWRPFLSIIFFQFF